MALVIGLAAYVAAMLVLIKVLRGLHSRSEMIDRMHASVSLLYPRREEFEEAEQESQMVTFR